MKMLGTGRLVCCTVDWVKFAGFIQEEAIDLTSR